MSYSIEILNEIRNFIKEKFDSEYPYYEIVREVKNVFGIELPSKAVLDLCCWSGNEIEIEKLNYGMPDYEFTVLTLLYDDLPSTYRCPHCGYYFLADNYGIIYEGRKFCKHCADEYFVECERCGDLIHEDDVILDAYENPCCPSCADNLYRCDDCGELFEEVDIIEDSTGRFLCNVCYNESYYICEECGRFVYWEDSHTISDDIILCPECFEDYSSVIHDYYYKPIPNFLGDSINNRYLGIELEVDEGGEDSGVVKEVVNIMQNRVYCKHDGSLNDGFEIVSHPATLDYHMQSMNWDEVLDYLRHEGYKSHDAGTCGLHIHLDRRGFGDTEEEQELGISKVLFFIERHWEKVVKFSRRTPSQLDEWAARYLCSSPEHPEDVLEYAKSDMSRYRAVNLCNHSTIEVRVFRGTLIYETFMAALQFCNLLYDIAELPLEEVIDITWNQFKEMGSRYKEFTSYIEKRGL